MEGSFSDGYFFLFQTVFFLLLMGAESCHSPVREKIKERKNKRKQQQRLLSRPLGHHNLYSDFTANKRRLDKCQGIYLGNATTHFNEIPYSIVVSEYSI